MVEKTQIRRKFLGLSPKNLDGCERNFKRAENECVCLRPFGGGYEMGGVNVAIKMGHFKRHR